MNPIQRFFAAIIDPPAWWFRFVDVLSLILGLAGVMAADSGTPGAVVSAVTAALALFFLATGSSQRLYRFMLRRLSLHLIAASLRRPLG